MPPIDHAHGCWNTLRLLLTQKGARLVPKDGRCSTQSKPSKQMSLRLAQSTYTWKPAFAGDLTAWAREPRQSGRPGVENTLRNLEAGPYRRPKSVRMGSPTWREAHCRNVHTRGSWSIPDASEREARKPDTSGSLLTHTF